MVSGRGSTDGHERRAARAWARLARFPMSGGALFRLRGALAPHWGALLALAVFLVAGLALLDDYGAIYDEFVRAQHSREAWAFVVGANNGFVDAPFYIRLYSPLFDWMSLFAKRSFGLEEARSLHLFTHLIIHLSFLAGGLFAYMLTFRLFGSRILGLFALTLFLLHPRLYAHAFFNSADIPFLAMFMIALFLAHRAFKRDNVAAFALLGVAVGILVNLRVMGLILVAAVPAMRALDCAFASHWEERKRAVLTTGAFGLACGLAAFALFPYLWGDPIGRAIEWWTTLSSHPYIEFEQFMGRTYASSKFPAEYLPIWFSITGPPFALLLGGVGIVAALIVGGAKSPRRALGNTRLRFRFLLVGCFALSIAAPALLGGNFYHGWRHIYFAWAPFALLAAFGLMALASAAWGARMRAAVYGAAGAGFAATLISMGLIHPNQQSFFNFLVDRVTPEHLRTQYTMEFWDNTRRQAFEWLLRSGVVPAEERIFVSGSHAPYDLVWSMLPDADQRRLKQSQSLDAFAIRKGNLELEPRDLSAHRIQVYGNTLLEVIRKPDLQGVYETTLGLDPDPGIDAPFDVYALDGALALVTEPCAPSFIENVGIILKTTSVDRNDLPSWREGKPDEERYAQFGEYGALFDGKCVASIPLPAYPIADIRVGWWPELLDEGEARDAVRRAQEKAPPLARFPSGGRLHLGEGALVYVEEPCDPSDTEIPFALVAFPEDASDLPAGRRARGYERFEFDFYRIGTLYEETCAAILPLPDYPVEAVRIGRIQEDGSAAWTAGFSLRRERYRATYASAAGGEPVARGAFDVHLSDGALVYAREECEQGDMEARFFLHVVPERVGDLPEGRREFGFDNLDFDFFRKGALFAGSCAARIPLPDYPVDSIRTGQYVSGVGEIWSVEFEVGR